MKSAVKEESRMAIGRNTGHSRGGRPNMGGGISFRGASGGAMRGGAGGFGGGISTGSRIPKPSAPMPGPSAFGGGISPVNINFSSPSRGGGGGGGLVGSLLGSAVSAGVGVASAAIVNKMHENSQIKMAEQQAEREAALARQQAAQRAELARQQAEYQVEIEKLKVMQEEARLNAAQDKRYYANCPYCLGVNNGDKFCRYCGSSLAYYDDGKDLNNGKKPERMNPRAEK